MNDSIGTVLKNARKNAGMTVEDVSYYLSKNNVNSAAKTIYGWENNFSLPNIHTFLLLCKLYGIRDILKNFGYESLDEHKVLYFHEDEYSKEELDDIQKHAEFLKKTRKH